MAEDNDVRDSCLPSPKTKNHDMIDFTGGEGPWQRLIFLIVSFLYIPSVFHFYSMTFLAPNIDHWCARPNLAANWSVEDWRNRALPPEDKHCSRYEDLVFNNSTEILENSRIIPCDSWEYNDTIYRSTLVDQWDLVCEREWLVSLSKSIFAAGLLFGNLLFGYLSDKLGRRPTIFVAVYSTVVFSIMCAFSTSFTMFLIFRFLVAVGVIGVINTLFVLLLEVVGSDYRATYCILSEFGWSLGIILLPAISWFIVDWFWIQIILTVPSIFAVFVIWWLPESPRWLTNNGRVRKAQHVIIKAARFNGVQQSPDDNAMLKEIMAERTQVYESGGNKGNIFSLLKVPGLWQISINLYFNWFVNAFVYYGLSFNTNELAGDPYINFALVGLLEIPAIAITAYVVHSLGRKIPLSVTMVICGITCVIGFLLPEDPWWLAVSVSMIGKFFITISFEILYVFSSELFPTVIRTTAMGSASICSRVGSIIAPFMKELGRATHPLFPQIIFGALAIASGLLVMLLPEARNCSIPDTIQEAAIFRRVKRQTSKTSTGNMFQGTSDKKESPDQQDMTCLMDLNAAPISQVV